MGRTVGYLAVYSLPHDPPHIHLSHKTQEKLHSLPPWCLLSARRALLSTSHCLVTSSLAGTISSIVS